MRPHAKVPRPTEAEEAAGRAKRERLRELGERLRNR
jgi:hypothetical protein